MHTHTHTHTMHTRESLYTSRKRKTDSRSYGGTCSECERAHPFPSPLLRAHGISHASSDSPSPSCRPVDDPRGHIIDAKDIRTIAPNGTAERLIDGGTLCPVLPSNPLRSSRPHLFPSRPLHSTLSFACIGAKAITVISKTGDVLLELEVAEEELRDQWVRDVACPRCNSSSSMQQ